MRLVFRSVQRHIQTLRYFRISSPAPADPYSEASGCMAPHPSSDDDDVIILESSAKKKPTQKRAAALEGDHDSDGGGGPSQQQAKKPRAKKPPAGGAATVDELGWTVVPPSFIFRWTLDILGPWFRQHSLKAFI